MDDIALLREYAERGSEPAFRRLVELHIDLVYTAALRRTFGDPHRAQEITQMVFTDLARKASQLQKHNLLVGWLHRSTQWAASNLRRTEQRRITNELAAAKEQQISKPDLAVDWQQISPLLDTALDQLSEADRDAVLLRYFENKSFAEIGERLRLSENAARMRVERALDKLQTSLAKGGITSTAAALAIALAQNAVAATPSGVASAITTAALGGVAGGGGTLGALYFMTKLQLTAFGLLAIGLTVGLSLQLRYNHELETKLSQLQQQQKGAETTASDIHAQIIAQESRLKQLEAVLAARTPQLTSEQQERVRLDTVVRKGELDWNYAMLFRRLKLPAYVLDKFKELIVERNQAVYDAFKLARNQGVETYSSDEEIRISQSGTEEIDGRIAALIGAEKYGQFREWTDLQPYIQWARSLTTDEGAYVKGAEAIAAMDAQVMKIATTCKTVSPEYLDALFQANGWPVDCPPKLKEALAKELPAETMAQFLDNEALNATRRKMLEFARDAALRGKVKLSKNSAKDYPATNAQSLPSK
ncbi:MAG: sigma-70 family RNA polymerase sigma factor [Nibricoccus sp.]